MSISAKPLEIPYRDQPDPTGRIERWRRTLSNALIITRREVRDSFRDWRIISPIIILTFFFPFLAQFVASQFAGFVESYGADVIGTRTVPFLLMIVGFFPISISLVIALETFVGEKERLSLEPLLSTPLTNTELYIGKTLAAMLPPLLSSYGGMTVYLLSLVLGELAWRPPVTLVVQIVLLTTVQALVMITGAVVVSSQTTSTRAANLLASFIIIPMTLLIQGESAIMFLAPDADSPNGIGSLWAIIAGMIVVVILLLRVGNSLFNREELLGRTMDALNLKRTARTLFASIRAVDERGTPARNLIDWYRHGIPLSVRRLGWAVPVTIARVPVRAGGGLRDRAAAAVAAPAAGEPADQQCHGQRRRLHRLVFRRQKRDDGDLLAERPHPARRDPAVALHLRRGGADPDPGGLRRARLHLQPVDAGGL